MQAAEQADAPKRHKPLGANVGQALSNAAADSGGQDLLTASQNARDVMIQKIRATKRDITGLYGRKKRLSLRCKELEQERKKLLAGRGGALAIEEIDKEILRLEREQENIIERVDGKKAAKEALKADLNAPVIAVVFPEHGSSSN